MVLTDDNFASIVAAIREGRGIFANIRKTLVYLLTGNFAELMVMLSASLVGMPLPLLPLHLLWINLVTDGLPALTLVMDPASDSVLTLPPRRADAAFLGRREWSAVVLIGMVEASAVLTVFFWALRARDLSEARSLAFSALVLSEVFRAFAARDPDRLFWEVGVFTNLRLLTVVLASALLQLGISQIPMTQALFHISALPWSDGARVWLVALVPVSLVECGKLLRRWSCKRR